MGARFSVFFVLFFLSQAHAYAPSAQVIPGISFEQWYAEILHTHAIRSYETAADGVQSLKAIDISQLPEVGDYTALLQSFELVRDTRFLDDPEFNGFARRSSWMYPHDGCFARAELARNNLTKWGYVEPKKVFITGRLKVNSVNSRTGYVSWYYHVVPGVRIADQAYVYDPAIEPTRPLTLEEWTNSMGILPETPALKICHPSAYHIASDCKNGATSTLDEAIDDQPRYLSYERSNIKSLGRNPDNELGDTPPWKK